MDWIFQMKYKKLKSVKGFKSYEIPKLAFPMMDTENCNTHGLPFQYCSFSEKYVKFKEKCIVMIKILNTFRSLIGLVLAVLGTLSGWGFVMYLDIRWQSTNLASLFLLLGVGMDDTFVMLNSWKRIKAIRPEESVEEKIQETYRVITK